MENEKMNLDVETVISVYDERITELQREVLMLKAQIKQMHVDKLKEAQAAQQE